MQGRKSTRLGLVPCLLAILMLGTTWLAPAPSVHAQDPSASPAPVEFPSLQSLPDAAPRAGGPLKVVATTPILADLARQVGGARLEVTSIMPPNADAHDFEPKPADLVRVEGAGMIVEHGLHLDAWASDLIKNAGSSAPTVVATTGVQTIASDEEGFSEGDPHVWFDPRNVKIMVDNIAAALVSVDPDGTSPYEARRDAYKAQLDQLDQAIANQIATIPSERRKLVTNHDAFAYYVARYGLTFVGSVIPSIDSRAEPSAKDTAELIDKIKAEGVPAIFTESSINPELEEQLAKEAGVKVVSNLYGDTLGEPGSGADTYIGMMETDTRLIVEALR
jgi:manganese/iron transport system substrate-binding protein